MSAPYGLLPSGKPRRRPLATCAFCAIAAGNSLGVKVLRYPLLRHIDRNGRHTSVCIGSIGLCDRCIIEHAALNERARPR